MVAKQPRMQQCLLMFLLICHLAGVSLFIVGFLLTRTVVPDYAPTCVSIDSPQMQPSQSLCLPTSELRFKRVVWILIDALRYDFVVYNSSLGPQPPPYRNKMLHVNRLLVSRPENIRLYKFIADPPTTTMQRLKALTTGGLPTFVDIGSNFNSYEITEDNLIVQCKRNGHKITYMGDDTWLGLYPNDSFYKSFPYPSLNVKDLHTVDDGVIEHMLPQLKLKDSDFVIAHLLGVDHCGHTYGPTHSSMKEKLKQMDRFLKDVFDTVTNDTIVFVFGDHGMTSSGDHGGESPLETDAALLVYSPLPLFDPKKVQGESVYQTDIVPTVSQLLGLPIPFSSLGMIIPDIFLSPWVRDDSNRFVNTLSTKPKALQMSYLQSLNRNMEQMYSYTKALVEYDRTFSSEAVDSMVKVYLSASKKYDEVKRLDDFNDTLFESVKEEMVDFIRGVRSVCVMKWAKFNDIYIYSGILLLLVHFVSIFVILLSKPSHLFRLKIHYLTKKLKILLFHSADWVSLLSLLLIVLHSLSLFSNSFVVYELKVVLFSHQTLIVVLAVTKLKHLLIGRSSHETEKLMSVCFKSLLPYFVVMVCARLSASFHSCRDQQDECTPAELLKPYSKFSESSLSSNILKVTLIGSTVFMYRAALSHCQKTFEKYFSSNKYHTLYSFLSFPWTRESICSVLVILLFDEIFRIVSIISAWIVYVAFIIAIISIVWKPWLSIRKNAVNNPNSSFSTDLDGATDTVYCISPVSWLLMIILAPIAMVIAVPNDSYIAVLGLLILQISFTIRIVQELPQVSLVTRSVLCSLLVDHYFFAFGHQATVNSLRFEAGFIGIYGDIQSLKLLIAGVLVGLNTLASQVIGPVVLPLLLPYKVAHYTEKNSSPVLSSLFKIQLIYIGIGSLKLLCAVVCASVLRRHLMLWAVFGPRFMYEAAFQTLSIVMTLFVNVFIHRVSREYDKCKQK